MIESLAVTFISVVGVWCLWVSRKLISIGYSLKYINSNLYLIDWEKVPRKNINEVFNRQNKIGD